ncbi:MAG: hypothetical protein V9G14_08660 [Cypionkella sp.]
MPRKKVKQLNWGAERRNAFIEFRVFWHGRINRSDLMDTFGISLQQASLDLAGYADQWKRNLVYDKSQRAYVRGRSLRAAFHHAQRRGLLRPAACGAIKAWSLASRAGSACFQATGRRQRRLGALRR